MDALPSGIEEVKSGVILETQPDKLEERVVPDKFDERYRTTKKEIYAYYWCVTTRRGFREEDDGESKLATLISIIAATLATMGSRCLVLLFLSPERSNKEIKR